MPIILCDVFSQDERVFVILNIYRPGDTLEFELKVVTVNTRP